MATGDNRITPLFEPADRLTGRATAAIGAGKLLNFSGDFEGGPALSTTAPLTSGNRMKVAHATAAGVAIGVALADASGDGEQVDFICEGIVPVVSSGAIAAGAEVEVGAAGVAVTLASGKAVGVAVSAAAGNIVYVKLGRY